MEQNNLDKKFREKLESRTIAPSNDAWARLEVKLDREERKQGFSFKYLWIAATLIMVLGGGYVLINNPVVENPVEVVDTNEKNDDYKTEGIEGVSSKNIREKEVIDVVPEQVEDVKVADVRQESWNTGKKEAVVKNSRIDFNKEVPSAAALAVNEVEEQQLSAEDKKAQEVAALIQQKQQEGEVTDEMIDRLLLDAQKQLNREKFLNDNKVDAMALLAAVETELDESFKEKVFEALKGGFNKVKTAVAQRNQ